MAIPKTKALEQMELRPKLKSELTSLSATYGIDLGRGETNRIIASALTGLKTTAPDKIRERTENALLKYLGERYPDEGRRLYNQMEGKKYWEALGLDNVKIIVQGKETTLSSALDECKRLKDEAKAERFREIIAQLAEKYRVRPNRRNELGIRYSVKSTDPSKLISQKTFNCFSGSIVLGQLIMYAAGKVNIQHETQVHVQQVASYTLLGGKWDDAGHTMVNVQLLGMSDEQRRNMFFDPMNTVTARHHLFFRQDPKTGLVRTFIGNRPFGDTAYRLGMALRITPELVKTARFQGRLFEMRSLNKQALASISKMPPLFISYFINNMNKKQQSAFFRRYNFREMKKIRSHALRYKLAAIASSVFSKTNPKRATQFGSLALFSLGHAISDPRERAKLPLGASLDTTIDVVTTMQKSIRGRQLIADTGAWAYLAYVASSSVMEISEESAKRGRDFMVDFYNDPVTKKAFISSADRNPILLITYSQGMLTLSSLGGSSTQSEKVLNSLYRRLGLKRKELVEMLRANALATPTVSSKEIGAFVAGKKANYNLERNFLIVSLQILNGTFSMETAGRGGGVGPGQSIIRNAVLETVKNLKDVLQENGPLVTAAKEGGLV